jgi:ribosome-associated protein
LPAKIQKIDNLLVHQILKSLDDRKAIDIVCIDLRDNDDAIIDYMIVCHGDSTTQVNAISGNLEKDVYDSISEKPHHIEGQRNAMWVIIDYIDVVVHVFYHEMRDFYQLEDLWSDSYTVLNSLPVATDTKLIKAKVTKAKTTRAKTTKAKEIEEEAPEEKIAKITKAKLTKPKVTKAKVTKENTIKETK